MAKRSREEKYPDTETFHYHNQNPKNRITTDCAIRAISLATGISYNDVVLGMAKMQCETGWDMSENKGIDKYLDSIGWVKCKQPRKIDNTKYTGNEYCRKLWQTNAKDPIIANIGGHHIVCIKDFRVWDTWNSTNGCIGNYWVKKIQ